MVLSRRVWALPALVLTLVLAACSTSDDLQQTGLEPQFGTEYSDIGTDVTSPFAGRVYVLSHESL